MLDLKFVRQNPEKVQKAIAQKHEKDCLARILELDAAKREKMVAVEQLRADRNKENQKISDARRKGEDASSLIEKLAGISDRIKKIEEELSGCEKELDALLLWLPNIPLDEVQEGGEESNQEMRSWGEKPAFDFPVKPHWELAKNLGILELERASRMSGSGFTALVGDGARLERALLQFMLDTHRKKGYLEIAPPYLVTRQTITQSAQLPKLEEDMYCAAKDDLFLIPTAEVPLVNFYQGEIFAESALPVYLMGMSACFRREAGTYGKDTRGLLRVHQFHKVELIHIVREEDSVSSLETMVGHAEDVLRSLGIPYRILRLATAELSFASAKTYDIEIWASGVGKWLEVSSCSTCTDFQARRANIRYKTPDKKNRFVHILNGSGVAIPRLMVALLENYQRADGHVAVPPVLRPYLEGKELL